MDVVTVYVLNNSKLLKNIVIQKKKIYIAALIGSVDDTFES